MEGELQALARQVAARASAGGHHLVTAESCTGGWVAKVLTDIAGSSAWFDCGVVAYSNPAKVDLLGVPEALLAEHGAVSGAVAAAMAEGARARYRCDLAVAVTGVAGPSGGTVEKPVGTVWLAWAGSGAAVTAHHRFDGDREAVRAQAVRAALEGMLHALEQR